MNARQMLPKLLCLYSLFMVLPSFATAQPLQGSGATGGSGGVGLSLTIPLQDLDPFEGLNPLQGIFSFPVDALVVTIPTDNNLPLRLLVGLTEGNEDFVRDLYAIVGSVNRAGGRQYPKIVLSIVTPEEDVAGVLKISAQELKENAEVIPYDHDGDVWLQDWGKVFFGYAKDDPKRAMKCLVFATNRGRGLSGLPKALSQQWGCPVVKAPSGLIDPILGGNAGNYGGNLLITPDNVLVAGDAMERAHVEFYSKLMRNNPANNDGAVAVLPSKWLLVGHVDEYLSFVNTEAAACKYAVAFADPLQGLALAGKLSRDEVEGFREQFDGSFMSSSYIAKNQVAAGIIEGAIASLGATIKAHPKRCQKPQVIRVPVVYSCSGSDKRPYDCTATFPDTVNMVNLRDHIVMPSPHANFLKNGIEKAFAPSGAKLHFIDDLFYHDGNGDVHCGTNVVRDPGQVFNRLFIRIPLGR